MDEKVAWGSNPYLPTPEDPPALPGITRLADTTFEESTTVADVLEEKTQPSVISVAPNPSNGKFLLTLPYRNVSVKVTVENILGEKLYESTHCESIEIDLSDQRNGVYLLRTDMMGNIQTQRIILNK